MPWSAEELPDGQIKESSSLPMPRVLTQASCRKDLKGSLLNYSSGAPDNRTIRGTAELIEAGTQKGDYHHHHHHRRRRRRRRRHDHHNHHRSLNPEGRWGTTNDFATSFLHFPLFSTALWDLANSRPVHSLMLSSHLFLCLPCFLPSFTVTCKMFWPDLINGRHDHTTAVCVFL